jgi:hypothetical protein
MTTTLMLRSGHTQSLLHNLPLPPTDRHHTSTELNILGLERISNPALEVNAKALSMIVIPVTTTRMIRRLMARKFTIIVKFLLV